MSYERDRNVSRGVGAIAAVDGVSRQARQNRRLAGRATLSRDRQMRAYTMGRHGGMSGVDAHGSDGSEIVHTKPTGGSGISAGYTSAGTRTVGGIVSPMPSPILPGTIRPPRGGTTSGGGDTLSTGTGGGTSIVIDPVHGSGGSGGGVITGGGGGGGGGGGAGIVTGGGGGMVIDPIVPGGGDLPPVPPDSSSPSIVGLAILTGGVLGAYLLFTKRRQ